MKKFKFKKIDAFASGLSTGNPAGAIYLAGLDDISGQEMQRIALELKSFVREVGFIANVGPDRYKVRYFSSEKEVEFCGHATIAIMYDLLKSREHSAAGSTVLLETNKGVLEVEDRIAVEDSVSITAPSPGYSCRKIAQEEICTALSISPDAIDRGVPGGIVNAGNETLCVPIGSLDALLGLAPDYETLKAFCSSNGQDVVTVFTDKVADRANRYRTRVFAAPFGYLEDPATGSGNAALGYHLLRNGLWKGEDIILEQNDQRARPNIIKLSTKNGSDGILHVAFGGAAITRIEGHYLL